jgi:hypothetical protein
LHRLEELVEVQQERREHPDGELTVEGEVRAVDEYHADGQVAGHLDARHERTDETERDLVGIAIVVVDDVEDLLVAWLAAKRLHGAHPVDRLDEVHDDDCDGLACAPVGDRRSATEPP